MNRSLPLLPTFRVDATTQRRHAATGLDLEHFIRRLRRTPSPGDLYAAPSKCFTVQNGYGQTRVVSSSRTSVAFAFAASTYSKIFAPGTPRIRGGRTNAAVLYKEPPLQTKRNGLTRRTDETSRIRSSTNQAISPVHEGQSRNLTSTL